MLEQSDDLILLYYVYIMTVVRTYFGYLYILLIAPPYTYIIYLSKTKEAGIALPSWTMRARRANWLDLTAMHHNNV